MIERKPHPFYLGIWIAWSLTMLASALFSNGTTRWALWASFFMIEGAAVLSSSGGLRDTLSEIWTWIMWHLNGKKNSGDLRGWNAMLAAYLLVLAWCLADSILSAGAPVWIGYPVAGLVSIFLYDHWTDPVKHG